MFTWVRKLLHLFMYDLSRDALMRYAARRLWWCYFMAINALVLALCFGFDWPIHLKLIAGCLTAVSVVVFVILAVGYEFYWQRQFRISEWDWLRSWSYPDNAQDLVIKIRVGWRMKVEFFWGKDKWQYSTKAKCFFSRGGSAVTLKWVYSQDPAFIKGLELIQRIEKGSLAIEPVAGGTAISITNKYMIDSVLILDLAESNPLILDEIAAAQSVEKFFFWHLSDKERLKEERATIEELKERVEISLVEFMADLGDRADSTRRYRPKADALRGRASILRSLVAFLRKYGDSDGKLLHYEGLLEETQAELEEVEAKLAKQTRGVA